ncbi:uncharacterized protein [Hetaerina americana]|uniref:uncharacterized protein n=1 Tax=Hetaerina americana TaxID=62018 RepID=UPI003A7F391C
MAEKTALILGCCILAMTNFNKNSCQRSRERERVTDPYVVQITVKKETSDNEDQEKVDRIMNNHEEDSLQGIVVKTEEVDVEDQETDEIPASQGDVDHNVKNLTIVDMDKISVEQQETAEIPARHRDMSSNMENQEETSEELCVLPSLQKDSESNGVDLMNEIDNKEGYDDNTLQEMGGDTLELLKTQGEGSWRLSCLPFVF